MWQWMDLRMRLTCCEKSCGGLTLDLAMAWFHGNVLVLSYSTSLTAVHRSIGVRRWLLVAQARIVIQKKVGRRD